MERWRETSRHCQVLNERIKIQLRQYNRWIANNYVHFYISLHMIPVSKWVGGMYKAYYGMDKPKMLREYAKQ